MKRKWGENSSTNQYYCQFCSIWVANNRAQRDQHESGSRHRAAKTRKLKQIAEQNSARHADSARAAAAAETAATTATEKVATGMVAPDVEDFVRRAWQKATEAPKAEVAEVAESPAQINSSSEKLDESAGQQLRNVQRDVEIPVFRNDVAAHVDENGFPLPSHSVYGKWETVEEPAERTIEENNKANNPIEEHIEQSAAASAFATVTTTTDSDVTEAEVKQVNALNGGNVKATSSSETLLKTPTIDAAADGTTRLAAAAKFKRRKPPSKGRTNISRKR